MTAIGIQSRYATARRRRTLAEELKLRGIRVIPPAQVKSHKNSMARANRPHWFGTCLFVFFMTLRFALRGTSLAFIPIHYDRMNSYYKLNYYVAHAMLLFAAAVPGLVLVINNISFGWALMLPLIASVCALIYEACRWALPAFGRLTCLWVREDLFRVAGRTNESVTPGRLLDRADDMCDIPDIRVYRERLDFGDDPFVVATRGWGPWREEAYFGAYNTGDPSLDNF